MYGRVPITCCVEASDWMLLVPVVCPDNFLRLVSSLTVPKSANLAIDSMSPPLMSAHDSKTAQTQMKLLVGEDAQLS
jgi:hypothetical protein